MLIFKKRYELFDLAKKHRLNKIYDLLNVIKPITDGTDAPACTDGAEIFVDEEKFNEYSAQDQFFMLCHESLHILYHHNDVNYYPIEVYSNRTLLNICQDVVINEYLQSQDKLGYRCESGLYLDNLNEFLIKNNIIKNRINLWGLLTTKNLYDRIIREMGNEGTSNNEDIKEALEQLSNQYGNDRKEPSEDKSSNVQQQLAEQAVSDAMANLKKSLKISDEDINYENKDRVAIAVGDGSVTTTASYEVKTIDYREMIKYIEQFVGNNAIVKGRHRSYNRPSRRIQLSNNMVAAGYKNYKDINKIQIYLDVSGSMNESLVSNLFGVLKNLYRRVPFDFYTFNHYIQKIDIDKTSTIYTSGGTDIQLVLDTIKNQKQDAAILITDCNDQFSLKNVNYNLMIYTNDKNFKTDNPKVKLTYFK